MRTRHSCNGRPGGERPPEPSGRPEAPGGSPRRSLRTGIRFVVTGLGSTATHVAVATILVEHALLSPGPANGAAFCAATLFSFTVNTRWSFSSRLSWSIAARFSTVTLALMLLSIAIASAFDAIGLNYLWGIACIVTILPAAGFLLHSGWTYRKS